MTEVKTSVWDDPDLAPGGEFVSFENVGDSISGTINSIRAHRFDDGKVAAQLLLTTDDGEERTVTAGQVKLKIALAEERPEPGDHIAIKLSAVEKRPGGKTLKHWEVQVQRKGSFSPASAAPAAAAAPAPAATVGPAADQTAVAAALANLTAEQRTALGLPAL